jgi:hemerythrin
MTVQWRAAMTIDKAVIDDDHRYLISLTNEVAAVIDQGFDQEALLKVLNSLKYYTVYHFVREEAAQRAADYPAAKDHAAEHRRLIGAVDQVIALLEQEIDPDKHERIKDQIALLLNNWLIAHIIKHDLPMRPYVQRMRAAMDGALPIIRA